MTDVMICYKGDWAKLSLAAGRSVAEAREAIRAVAKSTKLGDDLQHLRFMYEFNGNTVKILPAQEGSATLSECLPAPEKETANYVPQLVFEYDDSGHTVLVGDANLTPEDQAISK